ncbi:MAG: SDR family NAD(P)-dependent oxidoreductase, partial [Actinomycetota bacterium]
MDLGIKGRWAILAGSSRGLGRACAESIAREGVNVVINGRHQADVDAAVGELTSRYGVSAVGVIGDSATSNVQDELMAACPQPDILLLNGQGPSPKNFLDIELDDWDAAVLQALTGPLGLVQRVVPGMR